MWQWLHCCPERGRAAAVLRYVAERGRGYSPELASRFALHCLHSADDDNRGRGGRIDGGAGAARGGGGGGGGGAVQERMLQRLSALEGQRQQGADEEKMARPSQHRGSEAAAALLEGLIPYCEAGALHPMEYESGAVAGDYRMAHDQI
jgi:hypothetical protein